MLVGVYFSTTAPLHVCTSSSRRESVPNTEMEMSIVEMPDSNSKWHVIPLTQVSIAENMTAYYTDGFGTTSLPLDLSSFESACVCDYTFTAAEARSDHAERTCRDCGHIRAGVYSSRR